MHTGKHAALRELRRGRTLIVLTVLAMVATLVAAVPIAGAATANAQYDTHTGTINVPTSPNDAAIAGAVATPDDGSFVQMGPNSSITMVFPGGDFALPDGTAAPDLQVNTYDVPYPAYAEVLLSYDGVTFTSAGFHADTANIDLDLVGPVKYVKIVQPETCDSSVLPVGWPDGTYCIDQDYALLGFDLDAVVGLNVGTYSPPVANDDPATTTEGTPVTIDVLANDVVAALGSVGIQVFPAHGILGITGTGVYQYTPGSSHPGTDSFVYQLCDTFGICDTATVTITVEPPAYSLGDTVWYDQDQDGLQDTSEPGYGGVTVDLYTDASCAGTQIASGTTSAVGFIEFSGLAADDYCLQFGNIPAGWSISPANQGADETLDSDADASARISNITLAADDPDEDLGIYVSGSLGDSVSCSTTGTGLANITVSLFEDFDGDGAADGPAIASTTTDAAGFYLFTGLQVALAGDSANTTKYVVAVDSLDPDLGLCDSPVSPTAFNPSLDSSSPDNPGMDFTFEVANYPPVADANGPYLVDEGTPVLLDGSGSWDLEDDPAMGDITGYEWDVDGDGTYDTYAANDPYLTWTYPEGPAFYTIALRVQDSFGDTDVDTTTVTVLNVPPTVTIDSYPTGPVEVGTPGVVAFSFTDPGVEDTHTATCQWGSIIQDLGTVTSPATCDAPTVPGIYMVTVTVTDDDGGVGSATTGLIIVYDGYVNGGGQILDVDNPDAKKIKQFKISFGGWLYRLGAGAPLCEWEVNFHNVSVDDLDKGKFHGTQCSVPGYFPNPGESDGVTNFSVYGSWDGDPGYTMIIRMEDNTEPGDLDTIRFELYEDPDQLVVPNNTSAGTIIYDSSDYFPNRPGADFASVVSVYGSARTYLDNGNLQIYLPPIS